MSVRVRFAPSPTGPLHIGGLRTALYNYLFAKKTGGKMILRIEDTDQGRFVEGAENYIKEALDWAGIKLDEGDGTGDFGPYKQSERKHMYGDYAQILIDKGLAYYAFDTSEELDELRKNLEAAKVDNISYNAVTRMQMKNSLTLSSEIVKEKMDAGEPYVIRLKVPLKEEIRFKDIIRGHIAVHSSTIDDKVLMKSDGMPTYHLANIVDDHLMKITHVIRGEEWLPSAPLHILLYRSFGWEHPEFAHLPLLLKPEGNGKLSKRDGLLGDFPIFPLQWVDPTTKDVSRGFREDGFMPEATVNFLAFLGWNPGTDQEFFTMEQLAEVFSLEAIHKAGARFDVNKAKWYNQHYIREADDTVLAAQIISDKVDANLALKLVSLMKERVTFVNEIVPSLPYIFDLPESYDTEIATKKWDDLAKKAMPLVIAAFESVPDSDFVSQKIHDAIFETLEANEIKPGKIMQALRLAITGEGKGPDLMLTMEIVGKLGSIERIKAALEKL